jgi:hypothetical protein
MSLKFEEAVNLKLGTVEEHVQKESDVLDKFIENQGLNVVRRP